MYEYAEKIKRLRKERGLIRLEAARGIGVCEKTLYRYERGKVKRCNPITVHKIAEFYGVNDLEIWRENIDEAE